MSEGTEILRSYVRLLRQLSGSACVSFYVPPGVADREILVHDGQRDPVPELMDPPAAAEFHRRYGGAPSSSEDGSLRLTSAVEDGVLYRISRRLISRAEDEAPGPDRRKGDVRGRPDPAAWIGLRFEGAAPTAGGSGGSRSGADLLDDVRWWAGLVGLASVFVAHARSVSRALFDPVTGLPERSELQAELEGTLARVRDVGLPAAVLLLGPDDFAWVNERLDRRSGDRVLREVATSLRAALRSHDHVARYGGAIFAVILLDTLPQDARRVAENLISRLSDHRYHGGTLRLAFSAGVAALERPDLVEVQELIRRADQALSAAKRGTAGAVRVWERGSDVEHAGSLDRLQGIFTGDKSKDYRNMRLLLDSVAAVAASSDPGELAASFTERLFDTLHARRAAVLERTASGSFEPLGGLERSDGGVKPFVVSDRDLAIVELACRDRNFVAEPVAGLPGVTLCALPLNLQDRCLGGIVLEVSSGNVSFEGSDRRFLDALAAEMAVALDRARLIERERRRQREEKERLEAEVNDLRRVVHGSRLTYRSAAMESVMAVARKAARTDTTVLITGESGTGKEMLAHTLHELSERHSRPFVVVDCSAIAPTLIESELFGHEKGAFTGAHARKVGRLAQADGATVFLDEIGELPLDLQGKLLRFVQEKQFTPVGSVAARKVDVRIIAATNVDLRMRVTEGRFREDLFHRLNVVRLHVPPLRERVDDILHLANIFLQQFAALYRRPAHHFTARAAKALEAYAWPGNVRELQNLVLTSVLFSDAPEVDVEDLQKLPSRDEARGEGEVPPEQRPATPSPRSETVGDPAAQLGRVLAREIAQVLASGSGLVPLGKWLNEDLVLTADRLSGGVLRQGAALLGLPESTYRRQLQSAAQRRAAGLAPRSAGWVAVATVLEDAIRSRPAGTDVCRWAEGRLLAEIEAAAVNDPRTAAALLGVTEPTLLRRKQHAR